MHYVISFCLAALIFVGMPFVYLIQHGLWQVAACLIAAAWAIALLSAVLVGAHQLVKARALLQRTGHV